MNNLSEKYKELAKTNVREDESRREQSLEQFREWLSKHPFIKKCNTGLLHFIAFFILSHENFATLESGSNLNYL
jgi:CRISPR/Cas system CMR-associated protein Cmr5 small subunit